MVHIGTTMVVNPVQGVTSFDNRTVPVTHSVLVVRDSGKNNDFIESVCEFLDIGVERVNSEDDLGSLLRVVRPIAVIADLDGEIQDGFHVMKMAANYNPTLPVLLLGSNDPALLGAVDAVREIWSLTCVATATGTAGIGELVDFICHAARDAGMTRLMRV